MKKYKTYIKTTETYYQEIEVQAESEEEALEKTQELRDTGEIEEPESSEYFVDYGIL